MNNSNATLLEQLAINTDGSYAHIDELDEERKLFVEDLTAMPQAIAIFNNKLDIIFMCQFQPSYSFPHYGTM